APVRSAATAAHTNAYEPPTHDAWPAVRSSHAPGVAYPSTPPSRGTSDTATTAGLGPDQSTRTSATDRPEDGRAPKSATRPHRETDPEREGEGTETGPTLTAGEW